MIVCVSIVNTIDTTGEAYRDVLEVRGQLSATGDCGASHGFYKSIQMKVEDTSTHELNTWM